MLDSTSPIIGVTSTTILNKAGSTLCAVGQAYINAIQKAGGLPLVIPIGTALPDLTTLAARRRKPPKNFRRHSGTRPPGIYTAESRFGDGPAPPGNLPGNPGDERRAGRHPVYTHSGSTAQRGQT